jgi:sugar lactone lactonase YvrE
MKLDTSAGRTPATLATGQASPARLAMNATHLFWTNAGDGTIASVRKAGGEVRTIARDQRMPLAIAADADAVAWTCLGDGSVRVLRRR